MDIKLFLVSSIVLVVTVELTTAQRCYSCTSVKVVAGSARRKRDISDIWEKITGITQEVKNFFQSASSTIQGLLNQLQNNPNVQAVMAQLSVSLDEILEKVKANPDAINLDSAKTILKDMFQSSVNHIQEFSPDVKEKVDQLMNKMTEHAGNAVNFGKDLVQTGVIPQGLKNLEECGDPFYAVEGQAVCNTGMGTTCGKVKVQFAGSESVTRGCMPAIACDSDHFSCCDGDMCNSATAISVRNYLSVLVATVVVLRLLG